MKKHAFTLMELLTALAVIGIVAALIAPALTNIMPDKRKMQVIKAHKVLAEVTSDLLNDPKYYHDYKMPIGTVNGKCQGLAVYDNEANEFIALKGSMSKEEYLSRYSGYQRYCYLLSEKLETKDDIEELEDKKYTFSLIDGSKYVCEYEDISESHEDGTDFYVDYTITIDINGDKGSNTIATSKDVKNPDQFMFKVDTYGKVTAHPDDKLTVQYLKTRTKLNNKKEDYKAAFSS